MNTYISLLRGINVSGHKIVPMAELKTLYESLRLSAVQTYIQSGNVIFTTEDTLTDLELAEMLERAILKRFNFTVPVIVRNVSELDQLISNNPFDVEEGIGKEKLYVTFLSDVPDKAAMERIDGIDCSPDRFIVRGREIYLYCVNGYGRTKLNNNYFEQKLKLSATTRNWNTVNKLFAMAQ